MNAHMELQPDIPSPHARNRPRPVPARALSCSGAERASRASRPEAAGQHLAVVDGAGGALRRAAAGGGGGAGGGHPGGAVRGQHHLLLDPRVAWRSLDTVVQDAAFVLVAVLLAKVGGRTVRAWQFGLQRPGHRLAEPAPGLAVGARR